MRLPVRRLASTTLSAFLLLGVTGTAALAVAGDQPGESSAAVAQAPVADAATLLAQAQSLGDLSTVLKPTTDLLNAVLKADGQRLTPQESAPYAAAVREAITKIGSTTQASTLPAPASASTTTSTSTSVSPASTATTAKAAPVPGVDADALSALQKSVDALIESSAAGDTARLQNAANDVVAGLVDVVSATLSGSGMAAPDTANLPETPEAQQQPTTADQSATQQQPTSQQSSDMPASPDTQASDQQAPQTPDTPQIPDTPQAADMPQTSGMPETGRQPSAQDAPAELPAS